MSENEPLLFRSHRTTNFFCCSHTRPGVCCCCWLAVFLLLALTGSILFVCLRHHHYQPEQTSYILSIHWPPALCHQLDDAAGVNHNRSFTNQPNGRCFPNVTNQWLIHGLWPFSENKKFPLAYCNKNDSSFVMQKIATLQPQLHVEWTSLLKNQSDEYFWAQEWNIFGTCSPFDEYDYFDKTLKLFRQYSVDRYLASAGILPNNTGPYRMEKFRLALSPLIGSRDNIAFACGRIQSINQLFIVEIRLCFKLNQNGKFEPTKCSFKSNCGDSALYIN